MVYASSRYRSHKGEVSKNKLWISKSDDLPYRFERDMPQGKSTLEGQPAPDWVLEDADNNSIALENLKSKVLLIQFTSVSCGPCRASVPFLNQLESEYDKKEFDFVAIEAVPTFFILDENRVIRKVIRGYGTGTTDTIIRESINNLI